jgi:hypothetical protein
MINASDLNALWFVTAHQPNFLPWAGFWNKLVQSDQIILLANVQFDRGDFTHRVKLAGSWLTLPVKSTQHHALIKDLELADPAAVRRLAKTFRQQVLSKKNKYGYRLSGVAHILENWTGKRVLDLNVALILEILRLLDHKAELHIALDPPKGLTTAERLEDILMAYNGAIDRRPVYLSGQAGLNYMHFKSFKAFADVRFQLVHEGISSDSVVQLIAQQEDPLAYVRGCAKWVTEDGYVDDAQTVTGISTAL